MAKTNKTKKRNSKNIPNQGTTSFHSVLVFFRYSTLGKFLLMSFMAVFLVLFNIILSGNNLETFALLTGIEFVVLMIVAWTIFLMKRNTDSDLNQEMEE